MNEVQRRRRIGNDLRHQTSSSGELLGAAARAECVWQSAAAGCTNICAVMFIVITINVISTYIHTLMVSNVNIISYIHSIGGNLLKF